MDSMMKSYTFGAMIGLVVAMVLIVVLFAASGALDG
jgi:tetrahydromethanopterin S-methyltransferase subunit F